MNPDNPKNRVNSVAKAFAVLTAFDPSMPELTVSEVAARAELDRGTAFRLLHTLVSLGYLRTVGDSKRYRLALKCLDLGYNALATQSIARLAAPLLRDLVPDAADVASLGQLEGGEIVYLERINANLARHDVERRPGTRIGAYASALGHVLLAGLPEDEQRAALESVKRIKLSERTLIDLDSLLARLQQVRGQGYAVSDGENAYGLRTVAAAVFDGQGAAVAGISLTIDAQRMPIDQFIATAVPRVLQVAQELSTALSRR